MALEAPPKIALVPGATESSLTFVIQDEDHTLGNSLRYILMRHKDVVFCGYSMPHPSEQRINIRVQTKPGTRAVDAFREGLLQLSEVADTISHTFTEALKRGPEVPPTAGASSGAVEVAMEEDAAPSAGASKRKQK